jgi:hypothetical protein
MIPYTFEQVTRYQYQLAPDISHLDVPQEYLGHYITFVRAFGQWFQFDDTDVQAVDESGALEDNFSETEKMPKIPFNLGSKDPDLREPVF